jgi:hypothetical protein
MGAGGAALGVTMVGAPSVLASGSGDRSRTMTGVWKVHRTDTGGDYDGIFAFASGGVVTYLDINPVAPRPLIGVWSEGRSRFAWEIWTGFEADPAMSTPAATAQVLGFGTRGAHAFTSTYTVNFFDAASNDLLFGYDGTASGNPFGVGV